MSCIADSLGGQLYAAIGWIPLLVPFAISIFAWTLVPNANGVGFKPVKQMILVLFGIWLFFIDTALYIVQQALNLQRHDPYCPGLIVYPFPSRVSFYLAVLVTYLVFFVYLWNVQLHWSYWFLLFFVFVGPQALLCWITLNTWPEALLSSVVGVLTTAFFMVSYHCFIEEWVPYLVNQRPWTWCSAGEDATMSSHENQKIAAALDLWERKQGLAVAQWTL